MPPAADARALPKSPLAPCPSTPNCAHESRAFPGHAPDALFEKAQDALGELGPSELTFRDGQRRADAVFRVAFVFKDDVAVAVTPQATDGSGGESSNASANASVLHVRSASRVGQSDLGVNRRRVSRFWRELSAVSSQSSVVSSPSDN